MYITSIQYTLYIQVTCSLDILKEKFWRLYIGLKKDEIGFRYYNITATPLHVGLASKLCFLEIVLLNVL